MKGILTVEYTQDISARINYSIITLKGNKSSNWILLEAKDATALPSSLIVRYLMPLTSNLSMSSSLFTMQLVHLLLHLDQHVLQTAGSPPSVHAPPSSLRPWSLPRLRCSITYLSSAGLLLTRSASSVCPTACLSQSASSPG